MRSVAFMVVLLWIACSCTAETIYVDVAGPNDPGTGGYEDPFRRIQDAIDLADGGDTVEIRPGVYTGQGNYGLDPDGKSITIRSTNPQDPNTVAGTVIDPNEAGRGFYFNSGEDANCIVAGLTLRNGATDGSGAGIYCASSSPTIRNCVITSNSADWGGGGIFCFDSESAIRNCIIAGNLADSGGGVRCSSCSNLAIINCTISGNSAWLEQGIGIYSLNSGVSVRNSIIWGNDPNQIEAIGGDPVVTYSDVPEEWSGTGNIETDPLFVSFDPNGSSELWDFHLQSAYGRWDPNSQGWVYDANTSPCIDAGDPNSAWSAEPWPNGKRINMGAYGGTKEASMKGNIADFDVDGFVDFVDFGELAEKWQLEEFCIEDLTINGVVDFADLDIFTDNWLWQGP